MASVPRCDECEKEEAPQMPTFRLEVMMDSRRGSVVLHRKCLGDFLTRWKKMIDAAGAGRTTLPGVGDLFHEEEEE